MKRIKGSYEEHLRTHENIDGKILLKDLKSDFYYTAIDFPNSFLVNLYFFDSKKYKETLMEEDNINDYEDVICDEAFHDAIILISKIEKRNYLNNDLKKIICEKLNINDFKKSKYDIEYIKKNKKKFAVDLNKKEYEELETMLKEKNVTKTQFLRNAIQDLKNS